MSARSLARALLAGAGVLLATQARAEPIEPGREIRLPITRDTWVSDFSAERQGNLGAENRLKLKGIQELSLIDFDPAPLRGWTIRTATLHLHHRNLAWRQNVIRFTRKPLCVGAFMLAYP